MIIKSLTTEQMQRLERFTELLNARLISIGGEPLDLLEAHKKYQLEVDHHHGPWDDLVATIAAEKTAISYDEVDWDGDYPPNEIDED